MEIQEFHLPMQCDDGTLDESPAFKMWNDLVVEACTKVGVDIRAASKLEGLFRDRGFVNIESAHTKWALGPWPKGKREKEIGKLFFIVCLVSKI